MIKNELLITMKKHKKIFKQVIMEVNKNQMNMNKSYMDFPGMMLSYSQQILKVIYYVFQLCYKILRSKR